ncbi:MAG: HAAS signaling domain-containing protein [Mycobacterium sp.]
MLERSLRTFLPPAVVADAVREVETHILDRLEQMPPNLDERATVEQVLTELGPPLRVAQAYSVELTVDEAVTTGRLGAIARGLWHLAASTVVGFFASISLFCGYAIGASFLAIAILKPIFPQNVGFAFRNGALSGFGAEFGLDPTREIRGGYWIIPLSLIMGGIILIITQTLARRLLGWWQRRLAARRETRVLTP